jgi:hypothetical protein
MASPSTVHFPKEPGFQKLLHHMPLPLQVKQNDLSTGKQGKLFHLLPGRQGMLHPGSALLGRHVRIFAGTDQGGNPELFGYGVKPIIPLLSQPRGDHLATRGRPHLGPGLGLKAAF